MCQLWKEGNCTRQVCAFRHSNISKQRSVIPCFWESQPSGCLKQHCPFKHFKLRPNIPNTRQRIKDCQIIVSKQKIDSIKIKSLAELKNEKQQVKHKLESVLPTPAVQSPPPVKPELTLTSSIIAVSQPNNRRSLEDAPSIPIKSSNNKRIKLELPKPHDTDSCCSVSNTATVQQLHTASGSIQMLTSGRFVNVNKKIKLESVTEDPPLDHVSLSSLDTKVDANGSELTNQQRKRKKRIVLVRRHSTATQSASLQTTPDATTLSNIAVDPSSITDNKTIRVLAGNSTSQYDPRSVQTRADVIDNIATMKSMKAEIETELIAKVEQKRKNDSVMLDLAEDDYDLILDDVYREEESAITKDSALQDSHNEDDLLLELEEIVNL